MGVAEPFTSAGNLMMPETSYTSKEIFLKDEQDCREIEYKYLMGENDGTRKWEKGLNRVLNLVEFFHMVKNDNDSCVLVCDKGFDDKSLGWP